MHSSCVLRSFQIVPREVYINSLAIIIKCDFALFSLTHILDPSLVSCKCKCCNEQQFKIDNLVNYEGWTTRGIDRGRFRRRMGEEWKFNLSSESVECEFLTSIHFLIWDLGYWIPFHKPFTLLYFYLVRVWWGNKEAMQCKYKDIFVVNILMILWLPNRFLMVRHWNNLHNCGFYIDKLSSLKICPGSCTSDCTIGIVPLYHYQASIQRFVEISHSLIQSEFIGTATG